MNTPGTLHTIGPEPSTSNPGPPLDALYPTLRDSWIGGASALDLAPEEWQPILTADNPSESERRLLALAGQALTVGFRPHPSAEIEARPDLPVLDKPTMPDSCRQLYRTCGKYGQASGAMSSTDIHALLRLVDARGFSVHPFDWFPGVSTDDIPDTYSPWQDWVSGFAPTAGKTVLDDDTWAYTSPGERLAMLRTMRASDPDRALQLIADHAGSESAEPRFKLVEVLQTNLNSADADYLTSLSSDRSGRVKDLAKKLLGRLGIGTGSSNDLTELAGFITVSHEGLFKKKLSVWASPLKTNAQVRRRSDLFSQFSLAELAAALGITPDNLISSWEFSKGSTAAGSTAETTAEADYLLASMVAETGTDEQVDAFARRLIPDSWPVAMTLQPRASRSVRVQLMKCILASEHPQDLSFLNELGPDLAEPRDIVGSKAFGALVAKIDDPYRPSVFPLSMVATPAAASAAIDALVAAGVRPQDPWLAPLRLNLSLAQAKES